MLTNIARAIEKLLFLKLPSGSYTTQTYYYGTPAKDVDGNDIYIKPNSNYFPFSSATNTSLIATGDAKNNGVHIGSGTTAPSASDYCLENRISSGISVVNTVILYDGNKDASGNLKSEIIYTVQNTSNNTITISEVGTVVQAFGSVNQGVSTGNGNKYVLIDRTLLDTPLVLPAGESGAFTYRMVSEANISA